MKGIKHSVFKSFQQAADFARRMYDANKNRVKTWVEAGPDGFSVHFLRTQLNPPRRLPTKLTGAFRIDRRHAHIGKGLVYCEKMKEAAPPVTTHSRVKCGVCGETIQSAVNPRRIGKKWDIYNTKLEKWFERDRSHVELLTTEGDTIYEWWDEQVKEAVDDGFLDPRNFHKSAVDYANNISARPLSHKRNPGHGRRVAGAVESPRLIYGRASSLSVGKDGKVRQMTARKMAGPYKGKDFVHDFKPGVKHVGLPRGTEIHTPDGRSFTMKTRTALMVGPKNLWADFSA